MARNISIFFGLGLVWLFVFSLPVGKGKTLYSVLNYYVVDTRPVHWVVGKVQGGYDATLEGTEEASDGIQARSRETLSQGEGLLKSIE